jgi:pyruvate/2-oxoglutarate dehydrogenase complex dihydrolipoamide acyltransferase (E2) component
VRRLARDAEVELARVTGSGPHGRVTVADVRRAAADLERPTVGRSGRAPGLVAGEVEIPHRVDPAGVELLALVALGALDAWRTLAVSAGRGIGDRTVRLRLEQLAEGSTQVVEIIDAVDYSVAGLARRIGSPAVPTAGPVVHPDETGPPGPILLVGAATDRGVLLHVPPLPVGQAVAVGVGCPVRRPVVRELDTGFGVGVGVVCTVTVAYDESLVHPTVAARYLTDLLDTVRRGDGRT